MTIVSHLARATARKMPMAFMCVEQLRFMLSYRGQQERNSALKPKNQNIARSKMWPKYQFILP
jgi:hypothetical protein